MNPFSDPSKDSPSTSGFLPSTCWPNSNDDDDENKVCSKSPPTDLIQHALTSAEMEEVNTNFIDPSLMFVTPTSNQSATPISAPFDIQLEQQQFNNTENLLSQIPDGCQIVLSDGSISFPLNDLQNVNPMNSVVNQTLAPEVRTTGNIILLHDGVLNTADLPISIQFQQDPSLSGWNNQSAELPSTSNSISNSESKLKSNNNGIFVTTPVRTAGPSSSSNIPIIDLTSTIGSTNSSSSNDSGISSYYSSCDSVNYEFEIDRMVKNVDQNESELVHNEVKDDLLGSALKTQNLIRKNLPDSSLSHYLSRSAQEIADEIAKSLVDRALENDRKKLVRRRQESDYNPEEASEEDQLVEDNFVEVAAHRAMESVIGELINEMSNDVINLAVHGCGKDFKRIPDCPEESGNELLANVLDDLTSEFASDDSTKTFGLHRTKDFEMKDEDFLLCEDKDIEALVKLPARLRGSDHVCSGECDQSEEETKKVDLVKDIFATDNSKTKYGKPKHSSRQRNSMGILISTLQKKVYHCRCIDCQAERKMEGKPEPEEPIEVKRLVLPEGFDKEKIEIPKSRGRGRPRLFPRVEDILKLGKTEKEEDQGQEIKVKRKRGRPRKSESNLAFKKTKLEEEDNVQKTEESIGNKRPIRRGAGKNLRLLLDSITFKDDKGQKKARKGKKNQISVPQTVIDTSALIFNTEEEETADGKNKEKVKEKTLEEISFSSSSSSCSHGENEEATRKESHKNIIEEEVEKEKEIPFDVPPKQSPHFTEYEPFAMVDDEPDSDTEPVNSIQVHSHISSVKVVQQILDEILESAFISCSSSSNNGQLKETMDKDEVKDESLSTKDLVKSCSSQSISKVDREEKSLKEKFVEAKDCSAVDPSTLIMKKEEKFVEAFWQVSPITTGEKMKKPDKTCQIEKNSFDCLPKAYISKMDDKKKKTKSPPQKNQQLNLIKTKSKGKVRNKEGIKSWGEEDQVNPIRLSASKQKMSPDNNMMSCNNKEEEENPNENNNYLVKQGQKQGPSAQGNLEWRKKTSLSIKEQLRNNEEDQEILNGESAKSWMKRKQEKDNDTSCDFKGDLTAFDLRKLLPGENTQSENVLPGWRGFPCFYSKSHDDKLEDETSSLVSVMSYPVKRKKKE